MIKRTGLAVVVACLATSFAPLGVESYVALMPFIQKDIGLTLPEVQFTLAVFIAAFSVAIIFQGIFTDIYGHRRVLLFSSFAVALSSMVIYLSTSMTLLICARLVLGAASGAGIVVSRVYLSEKISQNEAQRSISFVMATAIGVALGGGVVASVIASQVGWREFFIIPAFVSTLTFVLVVSLFKEPIHEKRRCIEPFKGVLALARCFRDPRFSSMCVFFSFFMAAHFIYIAAAPSIVSIYFQAGVEKSYLIISPLMAGMGLGYVVISMVGHKIAPLNWVKASIFLMFLSVTINLALVFLFPNSDSDVGCLGLVPPVLFSFSVGLMSSPVIIIGLAMFPNDKGIASALQISTYIAMNALVASLVVPFVSGNIRLITLAQTLFLISGAFVFFKYLSITAQERFKL